MNEVSSVLVALSQLDSEISDLEAKDKTIHNEQLKFEKDCQQLEQSVAQLSAQHAASLEKQSVEEAQLKEEQRKIVERRKQLTALGGSRSAKLLEREVDVAGRAIMLRESRVVGMLEELEKLEKRRLEAQMQLELKVKEKETLAATWSEMRSALRQQLAEKSGTRETQLAQLSPQIKQTYLRISSRYPGTAVAKAEAGCCQCCFRSLPAQVFNNVIAGRELIQCPGCSRILVANELFAPQTPEAPSAA